MLGSDWIAAFAALIGVDPPDAETTDLLLALAGEAAHQSERTAAPIACYLAGRAGIDPARARVLAESLATPGSPA